MLTVDPGEGGNLTLSMAHSGSQAWKHECHIPLGQLATDQVGCASFDLSLIADLPTPIPVVAGAPQEASPVDIDVSLRLWVAPFGDEYPEFEALGVGENDGEVVVVRYEFTDNDLAGRKHAYSDYYFGSSHDRFGGNELDPYVLAPDQPVRWKDIRGFTVTLALCPTGASERDAALRDKWRVARMRVIGLSDDRITGLLLDKAFDHKFSSGEVHPEVPASPPPISDEDPEPILTDFIATETLVLAEFLMDHLDAFNAHYQAGLLADSHPVMRWTTIADARLGPHLVIHDTAVVAATMSL